MPIARRLLRFAVVLLIGVGVAYGVVWFTKRPRTTWYAHDADSRQTLKVLFVGNSLTYYHDVPGIVVEMFRQARPDQPVKVAMVTGPAFKLADHLSHGDAIEMIAEEGPWDWVVLQEYGGLAQFDPDQAKQSLRTLTEAVRATGARPIVYLDWHSAAEPGQESPLEKLAASLELPCVPIANAWHHTREQHPEIELQLDDGVHPTKAGAYLIALVFYAYLGSDNPTGLPADFEDSDSVFSFSAGLDETVSGDFQSIAWEAVHERPLEP